MEKDHRFSIFKNLCIPYFLFPVPCSLFPSSHKYVHNSNENTISDTTQASAKTGLRPCVPTEPTIMNLFLNGLIMEIVRLLNQKIRKSDGLGFVVATWLLSRLVLLIAMLGIAPFLTAEAGEWGWQVFNAWDGRHFERIATTGYEFVNDGEGYNVAFFPLFPLLIRGVMALGLPFEVAGTLVNNIAFLAAAILLYNWVRDSHGRAAAKWVGAVFLWCPFSLFGTVIYSEGSFFLFTIAALKTFEKEKYAWATFWGALATATRVPGLALIPTFLWIAWRQRRPLSAYLAALGTGTGLLLYGAYCWLRFGQPLAFYLAQQGWMAEHKLKGTWLWVLMEITIGPANTESQGLVDPWYPLLFLLICALGIGVWKFRHRLGVAKTGYGFWLLAGSPLINAVMVWGGAYLLWHCRRQMSPVVFFYGLFSFMVILAASRTASAERYAYGIVSLSIALGLLLQRHPRHGYLGIGFCAILLTSFGVRFAQQLWVG